MFTPFRLVMLFITAAVCGWLVLQKIEVDLLPAPTNNRLQLSFFLPGSSPDVAEQQVTSLIEGAISQLPHIDKISSASMYNGGTVTIDYDKSADMQLVQFELVAMIRRVAPQLPHDCSYPLVSGGNVQRKNTPFLIYSINAPQQVFQIKRETDTQLKKALNGVRGIEAVEVSGSGNMQIAVQIDINKCQALQIAQAEIKRALQLYSTVMYPGSIADGRGQRYFLRIPAGIEELPDLEQIIINSSGKVVHLKDVARIFMEEAAPDNYFRINGKNSVALAITARQGENKIVLAKQIKDILNGIARRLPNGYALNLEYDDTEYLNKEITKNYRRIGLSMAILLAFSIIFYKSWKYLTILFTSLLINFSLVILLIYLFHVEIHLYTLAGLAVSLGIMVDNAIVMIDHYRQWRNKKIFLALLASTLTIMAALSLVVFLPNDERNNLSGFALVVLLALGSSLLVALWFTPGLYELIFPGQFNTEAIHFHPFRTRRKRIRWYAQYQRALCFLNTRRPLFILLVLLLFGLPVSFLPTRWEGGHWYNKWYNATVGSEEYVNNIRPHTDKWLGGCLGLFLREVYEKSGYRTAEKTKLYLNAKLPYGHTIDQMNAILIEQEKYLSGINGIDNYITKVYSGQNGSIEINFKDASAASGLPYQLKSQLVARSLDWGGVEWKIYGVGQGFTNANAGTASAFKVIVKGYNYDELDRQVNRLAQKLLSHKRIQSVNTNDQIDEAEKQSQEYVLQIDKTSLALAGTDLTEVLNAVTTRGKQAGAGQSLVLHSQIYPVIFRETNADQFSKFDLFNDPLLVRPGKQIQIKSVGKLELKETANNIYKEERQYIRIVGFDYMGAHEFGRQYLEQVLEEMKSELPLGYTAKAYKADWDWSTGERQYSLVFVLIIINFFICGILFENLQIPLYIISMIPISFIGLFLVFSVGDFYFDQGGYAAFIMSGGLVVNSAIFIVTDFRNLRKRRRSVDGNTLLVKATVRRGRTILLTTISTCCGLIPFLLEGQREVFWFSLAIGTVSTLAMSMFSLFIILPVFLWKKNSKT